MRVAITYKDGNIFQHFGRSEFIKIYDVKENQIITTAIIPTNGSGHSALVNFLSAARIDALICGGIGRGARDALLSANIQLYPGATGNADEACKALINGTLNYQPDIECNHHDHDCNSHCH